VALIPLRPLASTGADSSPSAGVHRVDVMNGWHLTVFSLLWTLKDPLFQLFNDLALSAPERFVVALYICIVLGCGN